MLALNDIQYISSKTGLSEQKIIILSENANDLNLIINELSKDDIDNDGLVLLSFNLFTKLSVFRITKDKNFKIKEKSYISETISDIFPRVSKDKSLTNTIIQDLETIEAPNERSAQYYFVILSLFNNFLNRKRRSFPNESLYYRKAKHGFSLSEHKELPEHLNYWINTIRRMKEEYWN